LFLKPVFSTKIKAFFVYSGENIWAFSYQKFYLGSFTDVKTLEKAPDTDDDR